MSFCSLWSVSRRYSGLIAGKTSRISLSSALTIVSWMPMRALLTGATLPLVSVHVSKETWLRLRWIYYLMATSPACLSEMPRSNSAGLRRFREKAKPMP